MSTPSERPLSSLWRELRTLRVHAAIVLIVALIFLNMRVWGFLR